MQWIKQRITLINYLIDQYQEQTYLTLNNLNVSLKNIV